MTALFKVVSFSDPLCISFLVLITQELSLTAGLFFPLACDFLEGRDFALLQSLMQDLCHIQSCKY